MEILTVTKNVPEKGLIKGQTFNVLRNIMNQCVIIIPSNEPNIICDEKTARTYGRLAGNPQLGGV